MLDKLTPNKINKENMCLQEKLEMPQAEMGKSPVAGFAIAHFMCVYSQMGMWLTASLLKFFKKKLNGNIYYTVQ